MSTPWTTNQNNPASFQSQQTMMHSPFGPVPNFPWPHVAPGVAANVTGPVVPDRVNLYGMFARLPGLLKITANNQ